MRNLFCQWDWRTKENPHRGAFITHGNSTKTPAGDSVSWVKNEAVYHQMVPLPAISHMPGPFGVPFPRELFIFDPFIFTQVYFIIFVISPEEDFRSGWEQLLEWSRSYSLIIWFFKKNDKFLFIKQTLLSAYYVRVTMPSSFYEYFYLIP